MSSKRVKPGDVLRWNTSKGFAYIQYVGRHREYGDAVLVSPRVGKDLDAQTLARGYVAFYPAAVAVAQGLVEVVYRWPPPKLPDRLRRPGARSGLNVTTWIIENGTTETVKSKLSEDDLLLPIAVIWNHELLTQRVLEDWDPRQES